jgi:hypothetical protein
VACCSPISQSSGGRQRDRASDDMICTPHGCSNRAKIFSASAGFDARTPPSRFFLKSLVPDLRYGRGALSVSDTAHSVLVRAVMAYRHSWLVWLAVNCFFVAVAVFLARI